MFKGVLSSSLCKYCTSSLLLCTAKEQVSGAFSKDQNSQWMGREATAKGGGRETEQTLRKPEEGRRMITPNAEEKEVTRSL